MRILAISDVHGSESVSYSVREWVDAYHPQAIIVSGDITNFGPSEWAREFLDALPLPSFAVPGNCDPIQVIEEMEKSKSKLLHFRREKFRGFDLLGVGGALTTPFGTPFELSEEDIYEGLKKVMVKHAILVSHSPAKGHLDSIPGRAKGLGSSSLARIVKEYEPMLMLSGHIHEAIGVEQEGWTTFVNPGPAKNRMGAIIDIPDECAADRTKCDIKVELIRNK